MNEVWERAGAAGRRRNRSGALGALWELKRFPEQPIRDYLEQWKDRFWLFHPEWPFWQVPEAAIGTEYGAAKLNGEMSESSNKIRLFQPLCRGGQNRDDLCASGAVAAECQRL